MTMSLLVFKFMIHDLQSVTTSLDASGRTGAAGVVVLLVLVVFVVLSLVFFAALAVAVRVFGF